MSYIDDADYEIDDIVDDIDDDDDDDGRRCKN